MHFSAASLRRAVEAVGYERLWLTTGAVVQHLADVMYKDRALEHVMRQQEAKMKRLAFLKNLLAQIVLVANFLDLMELTFDPIDVMFFVDHDMF
jgi:hypothetical protein